MWRYQLTDEQIPELIQRVLEADFDVHRLRLWLRRLDGSQDVPDCVNCTDDHWRYGRHIPQIDISVEIKEGGR